MMNPSKKDFREYIQNHIPKEKILASSIFDTIISCLKETSDEYNEVAKILDYALPVSRNDGYVTEDFDSVSPLVLVEKGGSEGVYVDVYIYSRYDQPHRYILGTLKTLDEGFQAHIAMGKIAGMITYVLETYLEEVFE